PAPTIPPSTRGLSQMQLESLRDLASDYLLKYSPLDFTRWDDPKYVVADEILHLTYYLDICYNINCDGLIGNPTRSAAFTAAAKPITLSSVHHVGDTSATRPSFATIQTGLEKLNAAGAGIAKATKRVRSAKHALKKGGTKARKRKLASAKKQLKQAKAARAAL